MINEELSLNENISIWKLIALTVSMLGVQFACIYFISPLRIGALQIAFASPIFLELGVDKKYVSLIWLAGPISGLLVQPLVGTISDRFLPLNLT